MKLVIVDIIPITILNLYYFQEQLALDFHATITKDTWTGSAEIPLDYLPPKTSLFNAYAIHVSDPNRHYEALYPVPQDKYPNPDL